MLPFNSAFLPRRMYLLPASISSTLFYDPEHCISYSICWAIFICVVLTFLLMAMASMTGVRYTGSSPPGPSSEDAPELYYPQGPRMSSATMDWMAQVAHPSAYRKQAYPLYQDPQIKRKAERSPSQQLPENKDKQGVGAVNVAQITLEIPLTPNDLSERDELLEDSWQNLDIPQELRLVQAGTPQEIRTIIRDSLNHFQAVRDSIRDTIIHPNLHAESSATTPNSAAGEGVPSTLLNPYLPHKRLDSHDSAPTLDSPSTASRPSTAQQLNGSATTLGSNADVCVEQSKSHHFASSLHDNQAPVARSKPTKDPNRSYRKHRFTKIFRKTDVKGKSNDSCEQIRVIEYNECASCFDDVPSIDTISLACQHHYCSVCFSQLVATATQNEDLFPPKCCLQEIPRKTLQAKLAATEFAQYKMKAQEFSVSAGERWFCPSAGCGKWFDKSKTRSRGDTVSCPHCKTYMCQHCRGLSHARGGRCPQDQALDATLETAELNGWRRCYNCHAMVELASGCRHITCKCKAEFWYVPPVRVKDQVNVNSYTCCAKWRTCHCTETDEVRRRLNLGERRKVHENEDAEVRAAVAAVAVAERREAERQEREERSWRVASKQLEKRRIEESEARIAEEERMIERIEDLRIQAITRHYDDLRQAMARLHSLQYKAVSKRHSIEKDVTQRLADVQSRDTTIQGQISQEIASMRQDIEKTVQEIQLVFTRQILDTAARHRNESEKQSEMLTLFYGGQPDSETTRTSLMWELEYIQQAELNALRCQLDNDMGKLRRRAAAPQLPETLLKRQAALQKEQSDIQTAMLDTARRHRAEVKWMDTVIVERGSMLFEDEQRVVDSGAEVHGTPSTSSGWGQRRTRGTPQAEDIGVAV